MFLHEFPASIKSQTPFNLVISNKVKTITLPIPKFTINSNLISSNNLNILFTTPYKEQELFKTFNASEIEYLITRISAVLSNINLPENISIYHYDQIFNNNLFKSYKRNTKLTHIISSNNQIYPVYEKNDITIIEPSLVIDELNSKNLINKIANEVSNSLIFIKIKRDNLTNINHIFGILSQVANILNYDDYDKIFAINLKQPIDLYGVLTQSGVNSSLAVIDRSNELFEFLQ